MSVDIVNLELRQQNFCVCYNMFVSVPQYKWTTTCVHSEVTMCVYQVLGRLLAAVSSSVVSMIVSLAVMAVGVLASAITLQIAIDESPVVLWVTVVALALMLGPLYAAGV